MRARRPYQVCVCKEKQQNSQRFPQIAQWHLCQVNEIVKIKNSVNSITDMQDLVFFLNAWNTAVQQKCAVTALEQMRVEEVSSKKSIMCWF